MDDKKKAGCSLLLIYIYRAYKTGFAAVKVCISEKIGALVPVLVLAGLLFYLSGSGVRLKEGQPFRMQGVCGSEQAGMKAANDTLYLPPGVVVLRPHKSGI